mgnify:CR=1 FL=1
MGSASFVPHIGEPGRLLLYRLRGSRANSPMMPAYCRVVPTPCMFSSLELEGELGDFMVHSQYECVKMKQEAIMSSAHTECGTAARSDDE